MKPAFLDTRLGARIIAWIILTNACLSLVAAGVQLGLGYQRGKTEVLQEFNVIESSFRDGLETALWRFNFQQVDVLLDGIIAQRDVVHLTLRATSSQQWHRGDPDTNWDAEKTISLFYETSGGNREEIGMLVTRVSYDNLRDRLWDQLAALVLSNFLKTIIASVLMLLLFDRFVSRHLREITSQIAKTSWLTGAASISLDRPKAEFPDEIDQIASALNDASSKIRDAYDTLSDANREQSEFTYAISHDLKSPTNTLHMLLDELEFAEKQNLTPDGQELLIDARQTTQRMNRLIEDVLGYAQTIGSEMELQEVNLAATIGEVLKDLAGEISERNAVVSVGEMPHIPGVPVQIRLLFQNLISNAVKFSDPQRQPEVSISASEPGTNGIVRIEVRDNGIGIEPEHHDRIFGMFQRLHNVTKFSGTGLGLNLCRRIVSNHGGKIELDSTVGIGTTFTLLLPQRARIL